jgi:PAS domain S-box-containing protein
MVNKTLEGIVASWNRGAEKIFGYSAAEVGVASLPLRPPDILAATLGCKRRRVRRSGR